MFSHIIAIALIVDIAVFCIVTTSCLIYVASIGGKYPNPTRIRFMEIGNWVMDKSHKLIYVLVIVLIMVNLIEILI